MIQNFTKIVFKNWDRKITAIFLAIVTWLFVNHSQTDTKKLENVAVRLVNVPQGMTVKDLQPNGMLSRKISLELHGNKVELDQITSNDIEVVLDANDKSGLWQATISRKNIYSLNPDLELSKILKRVAIQKETIDFMKLHTEKLTVTVPKPIGEAPRDFQYLDIWPSTLTVTVSGTEEVLQELKSQPINLIFDLGDISKEDLEAQEYDSDEVSFYLPDSWKTLNIPALSDLPIEIDAEIRIDFIRSDFHQINKPIPINLFFLPQHSDRLNPESYTLATSGLIHQFHGLYMLHKSLYAKGVSRLFVDLVSDMLEISVLVGDKKQLDWSVQFLNHRTLEDKFVTTLMSDFGDYSKKHEEYLRSRFRHYMNHFQLYTSEKEKFNLDIELQDKLIVINENHRPD